MPDYYIVSLNHTDKKDRYITFWRPNNAGYCWPLSWAGKYPESLIKESKTNLYYYNNGKCSLAVRCDVVDSLCESPAIGLIDNNAGPVVRNLKRNWTKIRAALIDQPYNEKQLEIAA